MTTAIERPPAADERCASCAIQADFWVEIDGVRSNRYDGLWAMCQGCIDMISSGAYMPNPPLVSSVSDDSTWSFL